MEVLLNLCWGRGLGDAGPGGRDVGARCLSGFGLSLPTILCRCPTARLPPGEPAAAAWRPEPPSRSRPHGLVQPSLSFIDLVKGSDSGKPLKFRGGSRRLRRLRWALCHPQYWLPSRAQGRGLAGWRWCRKWRS